MSSALLKISPQILAYVLGLPMDATIEALPENDDGVINVIVTHDSIPDDAAEVSALYTRESVGDGHIDAFAEFRTVGRV